MRAIMPGGPLAGFLVIPIALLAGIYFLDRRGWRILCIVGLILWIGLAVLLAVLRQEWIKLLPPFLVVVFWFLLSEAKREFKD